MGHGGFAGSKLAMVTMVTASAKPSDIKRPRIIIVVGIDLGGAAYFAGLADKLPGCDCPSRQLPDDGLGFVFRGLALVDAAIGACCSATMRLDGLPAFAAFPGWTLAAHLASPRSDGRDCTPGVQTGSSEIVREAYK